MKDYHINIFNGENESNVIVITKDINRSGVDYFFPDFRNAWKKRYIVEVGDKVIDIFGNLVTVKEILHHDDSKTTNFLVEENGNTYCPNEFAGLFVKYLSESDFEKLLV